MRRDCGLWRWQLDWKGMPKHLPAPSTLSRPCSGCPLDGAPLLASAPAQAALLVVLGAPQQEAGVPVTNYGLLLSYAHSPAALERAMKPWGL